MATPALANPIATHIPKRPICAIVTPSLSVFPDCNRLPHRVCDAWAMPARPSLACFLAAVLLLSSPTLLAQTPAPPAVPPEQPPPPGLYTLHVYANLAQVPT